MMTDEQIAKIADSVWGGELAYHSYEKDIEFARAILAAASQERAASPSEDRRVFAILFDDHDVRPEIWIGEAAGRARFAAVSANWNAHLFVKIASNSRDDPRANDNAVLAGAQERAAEPPALREALAELVALKDLKDEIERDMGSFYFLDHPDQWHKKLDGYRRRKAAAGQAARAALASLPPTE